MYYRKLTGNICYLSPININDVEKYTTWLNDLEVLNYLSIASINISETSEKDALVRLSKDHNYAIIDLNTNEVLGNCGLMDIDNINRTAELGIFIGNKEYWGKGYGTEAISLIAKYGFNYLNLNNIFLRVFAFNERAIRSYKKVGFQIIGKRRNAIERNHIKNDIIFMDLIPEDIENK